MNQEAIKKAHHLLTMVDEFDRALERLLRQPAKSMVLMMTPDDRLGLPSSEHVRLMVGVETMVPALEAARAEAIRELTELGVDVD